MREGEYHNERFGFIMDVPVRLTNPGSCSLPTTPPGGYRVTAFEDGSSVYLAPTVYGELIPKIPGDASAGNDCVRIDNALPTIRKKMSDPLTYAYGWRMIGDEGIDSNEALLAFVRSLYGDTCTLGATTPTIHEGTADVEILGCMHEARAILKYSPSAHTAVTWKTDRISRFDGHDASMETSFRFGLRND